MAAVLPEPRSSGGIASTAGGSGDVWSPLSGTAIRTMSVERKHSRLFANRDITVAIIFIRILFIAGVQLNSESF